MQNRSKIGIINAVAIFLVVEIVVFLLAAVFYFAIGASDGGMQEGFQMASGVAYSWFAFAVLGFAGWVVCMVVLRFKRKDKSVEEPKSSHSIRQP